MFTTKFAYADYVFKCYDLEITSELIRHSYESATDRLVPGFPAVFSIPYLYENRPVVVYAILGQDETEIAEQMYRPYLIWSRTHLDWGVYFLGDNGYQKCEQNPAYEGATFEQIAFGRQ